MNRALRRMAAIGAATAALAGGTAALAAASGTALAASATSAVSALTATSVTSAASAAYIPRCLNSQLAVSVYNTGNAGAGSNYLDLRFKNVSRATCHLWGYPGVSAVGSHGNQLGDAAIRDGGTAQYVNIAPGKYAHVSIRYIAVVANDPASHPAWANGFRVYPPDDYYAMYAPYRIVAATRTGSAYEFLQVSRVAPGK